MRRATVALVLGIAIFVPGSVGAEPIGAARAEDVARAFISERSSEHSISAAEVVRDEDGRILLHAVMLEPAGFVLVTADTTLPPVVGHSLRNPFPLEGPAFEQIGRMLVADVALRLEQAPLIPRGAAHRASYRVATAAGWKAREARAGLLAGGGCDDHRRLGRGAVEPGRSLQ